MLYPYDGVLDVGVWELRAAGGAFRMRPTETVPGGPVVFTSREAGLRWLRDHTARWGRLQGARVVPVCDGEGRQLSLSAFAATWRDASADASADAAGARIGGAGSPAAAAARDGTPGAIRGANHGASWAAAVSRVSGLCFINPRAPFSGSDGGGPFDAEVLALGMAQLDGTHQEAAERGGGHRATRAAAGGARDRGASDRASGSGW